MKILTLLFLVAFSCHAFSKSKKDKNIKFVPGELIVKLRSANKSFFQSLEAQGITVKRPIKLSYDTLYVLKINQNKSLKSTMEMLKNDPNVVYSEPNYIYEIVRPIEENTKIKKSKESEDITSAIPNDPLFNTLWGLSNTGTNEPQSEQSGIRGADINALEAWDITKGDKKVKIAVIDTGIDYTHADLKNQMWTNSLELNGTKGVDDDGNGYIDDIYGYNFFAKNGDPKDGHGHGTHCAGTIGATHDNGVGVAGVMGEVSLVAIKFLSDEGSGSTEGAIEAIDYAVKLGVDIMSNSWGGGEFSQALSDAILNASKAGIVFVAAAGNDSKNTDESPHYPSSYNLPNVIGVAGLTAQNDLASWSNYGSKGVHVAAPGKNINSTVTKNGYKVYSGTSMATPHVAGVIGLLIAKEGRLPHGDLKTRVMETSEAVSKLRGKVRPEGGSINAYNLLADIRPVKHYPKESDWVTTDVEAFESAHPYPHNFTDTKTYTIPGAKFIRLKIEKLELESGYDFLELYSGADLVDKVSGSGIGRETPYVDGDTIKIVFKTDNSVNKWGFLINKIQFIK